VCANLSGGRIVQTGAWADADGPPPPPPSNGSRNDAAISRLILFAVTASAIIAHLTIPCTIEVGVGTGIPSGMGACRGNPTRMGVDFGLLVITELEVGTVTWEREWVIFLSARKFSQT